MAEATYRIGRYTVGVPDGFGPRLLGFRAEAGPEMLVRLGPDVALHSGAGTVHFRGGHRLWASPEVPDLTHIPDDEPCEVVLEEGRLRVTGPVDAAGFTKQLEVSANRHGLVVDHQLGWSGPAPVRVGAWAITQLPLGGTALLPLGGREGTGYQGDRSLVLWPYTDLNDDRLGFRERTVVMAARPGPQLKLGSGPAPGRLGYLREGWLFTKTVEPAGEGDYPDRGAVGQVYMNEDFCELESLGPLAELEPGSEVRHREVWDALECPDLDSALTAVMGEEAG